MSDWANKFPALNFKQNINWGIKPLPAKGVEETQQPPAQSSGHLNLNNLNRELPPNLNEYNGDSLYKGQGQTFTNGRGASKFQNLYFLA